MVCSAKSVLIASFLLAPALAAQNKVGYVYALGTPGKMDRSYSKLEPIYLARVGKNAVADYDKYEYLPAMKGTGNQHTGATFDAGYERSRGRVHPAEVDRLDDWSPSIGAADGRIASAVMGSV